MIKRRKYMIYAGTGHRPPRLGLSYTSEDEWLLRNFITNELEKIRPKPTIIISGMAQGFDMCLAEAAIALKIPFWAYIPFESQPWKWPKKAQERYQALLDKAAKVDIISTGGYENSKFHKRDKAMVDSAEKVIALYDSVPKGGTALTVKYASEKGKDVINLWKSWEYLASSKDKYLLGKGVIYSIP